MEKKLFVFICLILVTVGCHNPKPETISFESKKLEGRNWDVKIKKGNSGSVLEITAYMLNSPDNRKLKFLQYDLLIVHVVAGGIQYKISIPNNNDGPIYGVSSVNIISTIHYSIPKNLNVKNISAVYIKYADVENIHNRN
ncbi:MAG: hypothetical protein JXR97_15440 [Planctomycetes bacterium]|nr:hypothetical protein [Planctomycetota bacterium]